MLTIFQITALFCAAFMIAFLIIIILQLNDRRPRRVRHRRSIEDYLIQIVDLMESRNIQRMNEGEHHQDLMKKAFEMLEKHIAPNDLKQKEDDLYPFRQDNPQASDYSQNWPLMNERITALQRAISVCSRDQMLEKENKFHIEAIDKFVVGLQGEIKIHTEEIKNLHSYNDLESKAITEQFNALKSQRFFDGKTANQFQSSIQTLNDTVEYLKKDVIGLKNYTEEINSKNYEGLVTANMVIDGLKKDVAALTTLIEKAQADIFQLSDNKQNKK